MEIGIFAKTFTRSTVEEVFDAVKAYGLQEVQFNLASAGLLSLPDEIPTSVATHISEAAQSRDVRMVAVSGTYNMIHPDKEMQRQGLQHLRVLAAACKDLGTDTITLCTGTRNPSNMWEWHPDNTTSEAWSDLLHSMEIALHIAEEEHVTLAIEPESTNVVYNAVQAQALLRTMGSPRLKIIIDPANIIEPGANLENQHYILDQAFDLLGEHIIIAHAKDRRSDGAFCAAGEGEVDYQYYLALLQERTPTVSLVMHGLAEAQVAKTLRFLREKLTGKS